MGEDSVERMRERLDAVYRADSRRVLATLIRLLGDFDLAEEAAVGSRESLHLPRRRDDAPPPRRPFDLRARRELLEELDASAGIDVLEPHDLVV